MTSLTGNTATLRRRLLGVLTATGLGGATAVVLLSAPSAVGASDPCAASEMARTISNVARSAGDYLDGHPETNQAMTTVLQQPAGPQSVNSLKSYFDANPKAASDMQTIASPLAGLSSKCQMPISIPQVLGFMQGAQGGLPGGVPGGLPGGAAAQAIAGAQGALPSGGLPAAPGAAAMPGLSAIK
jgi:hemophore